MLRTFELNLPPNESQTEFLAHFNSALRQIQEAGHGTAGFRTDGSFVALSTSRVKIGGSSCELRFSLITGPDRVLSALEVETVDEASVDWEPAIEALVRQALTSALARRRIEFFHRLPLSYFGANLDGEYWLGGFRLAPAIPNDPEPHLINAERIVYLEFTTNAVDRDQAFVLARTFVRKQLARLAFLLDFSFIEPDYTMRWVQPPPSAADPDPRSVRWATVFRPQESLPPRKAKKGEFCHAGKFSGSLKDRFRLSAGDLVTLPTESRAIFRALNVDPRFEFAVDACARLYHLSQVIHRHSTSAALAYRVAAVDSLCQNFAAGSSPSGFLRHWLTPFPGLEDLLNTLHGSIRSAHLHSGATPLDQHSPVPFHPFFTSDYVMQSQLADLGFWATRDALMRWLVVESETRIRR
jgi:hypothetical protein